MNNQHIMNENRPVKGKKRTKFALTHERALEMD